MNANKTDMVGMVGAFIIVFSIGFFAGVHPHRPGSLDYMKGFNNLEVTDSSGTVYRIKKLGIWKDDRFIFEKKIITVINDSTYEQHWERVTK